MHPNEHRNGYQLSTKWALTLGSDCQSSAAGLYAGRGCALIDGSGNMFEYGTSICGYYMNHYTNQVIEWLSKTHIKSTALRGYPISIGDYRIWTKMAYMNHNDAYESHFLSD